MSKRQTTLTSLWSDSEDDDCVILDPLPASCSTNKKTASVTKVSSTKKVSQWVSSAFDGFGDFASEVKPSTKRNDYQKTLSAMGGRDRPPVGKRSYKRMNEGLSAGTVGSKVEKREKISPEMSLWSEKYTPETQADLAVHKKKIAEVEDWIQGHLSKKKLPPILLLTGSAGVGKTATVRVLAKQFHCEVHEWSNPLTSEAYDAPFNLEDWKARSRVESCISTSQTSQFQEFLLRANKYNTLDIFGGGVATRRIIMVEDFPNIFFREPGSFHEILRRYLRVGGSPLIFIVSDSTSGESTERLLFPKEIQAQLGIVNISFNPVAMTSLTKILTKIATEESSRGSHKFSVPDKSAIESIAMACAGDIRGAINALQFACLKDTCDLASSTFSQGKPSKLTKKSSSTGRKAAGKRALSKTSSFQRDEDLLSIGGRDTSLFLFRALGKILYCKRDEPSADPGNALLPNHLSQCYRDPLQVQPEDVVEKCHLSGDYFSAYLHQNYMEFFTSVEDVVTASEYLSDADYLTINWASRSALQLYAASVATRGIMFSNSARARHTDGGGGLGWKPLHKPQWYTTNKQARQNCQTARYLFRAYGSSPVVLQTELIPYMALINTTLHDTGQISFMQEMCRFSSQRLGRYEKLDEKDVDISIDDGEASLQATNQMSASASLPLETDDDVISNSQTNVKTSQKEQDDEDYEIEDFDD